MYSRTESTTMNDSDGSLEEAHDTLLEHIEAALEHADDETAVFHLRHAKQLAIDVPTVAEQRSADGTEADAGTGV